MIRLFFLLFLFVSSLYGTPAESSIIESSYDNPFSGEVQKTDLLVQFCVKSMDGQELPVSMQDSLASLFLSYQKDESSHFGTVRLQINSAVMNDSVKLILSPVGDSLHGKNVVVAGKRYLTEKKLPETLHDAVWGGVRTKFWTALMSPVDDTIAVSFSDLGMELTVDKSVVFNIYTGPVDREALKKGPADLSPLLYYELWPWVRWISIALQKLLHLFVLLVKSYGLAIILLSVFVKIAMYPLVKIADKWQEDVNRTKSMLQPKIDEITKEYKGEEQHNRIMALYKENGVSPFYTVKSLAGFFIQIPVFFAAYHTLGEELSLKGFSFLWINDLAVQDHFLKLPFSLPYFGEYLNLLPLLMTVITILSAYIHTDESLSPQLLKKQRVNLYSMAFLFFILFYRFPAAMVLYWTMNNVSAFIKAVYLKFIKPKRA